MNNTRVRGWKTTTGAIKIAWCKLGPEEQKPRQQGAQKQGGKNRVPGRGKEKGWNTNFNMGAYSLRGRRERGQQKSTEPTKERGGVRQGAKKGKGKKTDEEVVGAKGGREKKKKPSGVEDGKEHILKAHCKLRHGNPGLKMAGPLRYPNPEERVRVYALISMPAKKTPGKKSPPNVVCGGKAGAKVHREGTGERK